MSASQHAPAKRRKKILVDIEKEICVDISTSVSLDVEEFVESLDDDQAAELLEALGRKLAHAAPMMSLPLMERLYLSVSRGEPNIELEREVLREVAGRIV